MWLGVESTFRLPHLIKNKFQTHLPQQQKRNWRFNPSKMNCKFYLKDWYSMLSTRLTVVDSLFDS